MFTKVYNSTSGDGCTEWCYVECPWLLISGSDKYKDIMGLYKRENGTDGSQRSHWRLQGTDAVLYASGGPENFDEWVLADTPNVTIYENHSASKGVRIWVENGPFTPNWVGEIWRDAETNEKLPSFRVTCIATPDMYTQNVQASKELLAYGNNFYGQLKTIVGSQTQRKNDKAERVGLFPGDSLVKDLSISCNHGLSVTDDLAGSVYAWGSNIRGELGVSKGAGIASSNPNPGLVNLGGMRAHAVAAGGQFSIALVDFHAETGGILMSWGSNEYSALGRVTSNTFDFVPGVVDPPDGQRYMDVKAGRNHVLAIDKNGVLW